MDAEIWFKNHVTILGEENAIPTSITEFGYFITRGEMAEMIYRLEENITDKESQTYEQLVELEGNPDYYAKVKYDHFVDTLSYKDEDILGIPLLESGHPSFFLQTL